MLYLPSGEKGREVDTVEQVRVVNWGVEGEVQADSCSFALEAF